MKSKIIICILSIFIAGIVCSLSDNSFNRLFIYSWHILNPDHTTIYFDKKYIVPKDFFPKHNDLTLTFLSSEPKNNKFWVSNISEFANVENVFDKIKEVNLKKGYHLKIEEDSSLGGLYLFEIPRSNNIKVIGIIANAQLMIEFEGNRMHLTQFQRFMRDNFPEYEVINNI